MIWRSVALNFSRGDIWGTAPQNQRKWSDFDQFLAFSGYRGGVEKSTENMERDKKIDFSKEGTLHLITKKVLEPTAWSAKSPAQNEKC